MIFVSFKSITTCVASGTGIANTSGAPEFTGVFSMFLVAIVFCVVFYRSLFILLLLAVLLIAGLGFRATDLPFVIFKLQNIFRK
jgi:hypothetical protein